MKFNPIAKIKYSNNKNVYSLILFFFSTFIHFISTIVQNLNWSIVENLSTIRNHIIWWWNERPSKISRVASAFQKQGRSVSETRSNRNSKQKWWRTMVSIRLYVDNDNNHVRLKTSPRVPCTMKYGSNVHTHERASYPCGIFVIKDTLVVTLWHEHAREPRFNRFYCQESG